MFKLSSGVRSLYDSTLPLTARVISQNVCYYWHTKLILGLIRRTGQTGRAWDKETHSFCRKETIIKDIQNFTIATKSGLPEFSSIHSPFLCKTQANKYTATRRTQY